VIAPWVLHRHRRFWMAPDRSDPSRFLPDRSPPPRFAYMPFGAGPRICVGNPFALTELVLVVATIARSFRVGWRRIGRWRQSASSRSSPMFRRQFG
jgi:cytochrome P450